MTPAGFPHSDISGSSHVSSSPKLFAAYHVLHRLLAPRHPPCALRSLTFTLSLAPVLVDEPEPHDRGDLLRERENPDPTIGHKRATQRYPDASLPPGATRLGVLVSSLRISKTLTWSITGSNR